MINKLKIFFLKPSKVRSITSISIMTILTFSFTGMAITGIFLNKNTQTISKLEKLNKQFIFDESKEIVNGVNVSKTDWTILSNYFGDGKSINPLWLMFNGDASSHKYWNSLYRNGQLFKIENSYQCLNNILDKYQNQSSLFSSVITTNKLLNYNLGDNNVILPFGIILTIISFLILWSIIKIYLINLKNLKVDKTPIENNEEEPDLNDDEDLPF